MAPVRQLKKGEQVLFSWNILRCSLLKGMFTDNNSDVKLGIVLYGHWHRNKSI